MESGARSRKARENHSSARSANPINSINSISSIKSKKSAKSKSNNKSVYSAVQLKEKKENKQNLNNINNISNINMAGVGVLNIPGRRAKTRSADLDRYRERARESQKFPNTRKKIITGKDLTTPLRRAKVKETRIYPKIVTVAKQKQRFPFGIIMCLCTCTIALSCLIWSYIVLNGYSHDVNNQKRAITTEDRQERDLESELELKNDITFFTEVAVNELGMVKEELLPRHYIAVKSKDRAEIVKESDGIIFRLPGILSALLGEK